MSQAEEIDRRHVLSGDERDFQVPQELSHRHPEIVTDHENALQVRAVALAQGAEQIAVVNVLAAVQPLLKLIEHNQQLFAGAKDVPRRTP